MNRRNFVFFLGGFIVGIASRWLPFKSKNPHRNHVTFQQKIISPSTKLDFLSGQLTLVGYSPIYALVKDGYSILTKVDLERGQTKQNLIPIKNCIKVRPINKNLYACLADNDTQIYLYNQEKQKIVNRIGGRPETHYLIDFTMTDKHIYALLRTKSALKDNPKKDFPAIIQVFDRSLFKLKYEKETESFFPFSKISVDKGEKTLAISYWYNKAVGPHNNKFSFVSLYNALNGEYKKRYFNQGDHNLIFPVFNENNKIVTATYNKINIESPEFIKSFTKNKPQNILKFTNYEYSIDFGRIHTNEAIYIIDNKNNTSHKIDLDYKKHRACVSNVYHPDLDKFFMAYGATDSIISINAATQELVSFSTNPWNITTPKALAPIIGTPYVAVAGKFRNVSIFNGNTGDLAGYYPTHNFVATGLSYLP